MIKALIIDDEPAAAEVLRLLLKRHNPEVSEVLVETDSVKALAQIEKFKPQLVFMDIVMPEMTGFEVLNNIPNKNFDVIFTTAFNEYAIQAIRFSAVDYLLKPIDAEELKNAVKRHLNKHLGEKDFEVLYTNLLQNLAAKATSEFKLAIPTRDGAMFISTSELMRCEGEGNYTRFFLTGNRKHISSKTIKEYEEILAGHNFIRVHKSHLVNRDFISNYLSEGAVMLKDNVKVPVSRRRRDSVKKILSLKQS
jgi:two-component system, LytTR family, response regulator